MKVCERKGSATLWTLLWMVPVWGGIMAMIAAVATITTQNRLASAMQIAAIEVDRQTQWPTVFTVIDYQHLVLQNLASGSQLVINHFFITPNRQSADARWKISAIATATVPIPYAIGWWVRARVQSSGQ